MDLLNDDVRNERRSPAIRANAPQTHQDGIIVVDDDKAAGLLQPEHLQALMELS